jgi:putative NADH-flavin reductase
MQFGKLGSAEQPAPWPATFSQNETGDQTGMNLTIFGATGETGRLLVERAINESHNVTVLARNPDKLQFDHENLTVIHAELENESSIDSAIEGADAVISLLGPVGKVEGKPISEATVRIITAMKRHNVRRLIAVATPAARTERDGVNMRFALMNLFERIIASSSQDDIIEMAGIVEMSGLDWTLVRLPVLSSDDGRGRVRAGYLGQKKLGSSLTRDDLVEFLLDLVMTGEFVKESPIVTN